MQLDFGIYKAIVTDNLNFYNTGKIRVRIQKFYTQELSWDMSTSYNQNDFNKDLLSDTDALVHTPIGGGNNYGLFALPQVNSVGLVQFLSGDINIPIWMGSYFRPEFDQNKTLVRVNVPNDQPTSEGMGSDGIVKGTSDNWAKKQTKGGPGSIVLRTKTTEGPGTSNNASKMDFNKRRSENLVVLSEEEIKIIHFSKWIDKGSGPELGNTADLDQFEEITIGTAKTYAADGRTVLSSYPQIDIKVTDANADTSKTKTTGIKINPNEVSLEVTDKASKKTSKISSVPTGINIQSINTNTNQITKFEMDPVKILVTNKTVSMLIEAKDVTISVPDGALRLSGKEVILGDGGGYIMVKDNQLPVRMEDGSILKASKVKA